MLNHEQKNRSTQQAAGLTIVWRGLRGALASAAALAGLLWVTPASAVANMEGVLGTASATNSVASKTVTASCPAGKKFYVGGAQIDIAAADSGKVTLHSVTYNAALTTLTVEAVEVGTLGYSGTWSVRARGICGTPVANMTLATATGAQSVSDSKSTQAACPAGKVSYGVGFRLTGAGRGVIFVNGAIQRVIGGASDPNGSLARAVVDNLGFASSWGLDAQAICGDKAGGYQRLSTSTSFDQVTPKTLSVVCPAGKRVHGHGWGLTGSFNNLVVEDWFFTSAALSSWILKAAVNIPPGDLALESSLICANF